MKSPLGTAVRPALVSLLLLGVAACGPTSGTQQAAPVDMEAVGNAAPATTSAPATPANPAGHAKTAGPAARPSGSPRAGAGSQAATPSAGRPAEAATLPVAAAQPGAQQAAIGAPGKDGAAVAPEAGNLKVTAYDPAAGTAVLSAAAPTGPSAGASATPTAAATPAEAVKPGQLLASPPTEAAPQGALVAVTAVKSAGGGAVTVATRPATLSELLGSSEADGKVPVDPNAIKVTPLVKDLKATVARENGTTKADASGTLEVDVNAPIPLPDGLSAAASASLQLHPALHFAYHGAGVGSPRTASIGFDLGAHAQWKVSGDLARSTGSAPIRLPFAKLQASPVVTVAGLPVVVNLGLTCYLEIGADGKVHVEAEQEITGTWAVHADYTGGRGWTSGTDAADTKVSPVHVRVSGKAAVRAALAAEVSVGLYDTVGVEATVAPYLRAQADGSLAVDVPGGSPQLQGSWALLGGVDLNGALTAHLKVFGTPVIEGKLPLPPFHREWPLLSGALPSASPKS
ncbi:hypothetical protein [Streptomyces sp. CB01881]|uniref:hypothetical protein n=1 Tax=Streptomyces sp. CB01881 TaxID=2078691 RepID=UPI0011E00262|nr:hypothetical protein [Streptomyces sp. CB01881]TYC77651.1 hypothetical protein EH183_09665 [Streptomyces sp. CB01881]